MLKINGERVGTELFPNNERICKTNVNPVEIGRSHFDFLFRFDTDMDIVKLQLYKHYLMI